VPHAVSAISLIRGLYEECNRVINGSLSGCSLPDAASSKLLVDVNQREGSMHLVIDALTGMAKDGFLPSGG
jgi:hypothetical protein